MSEHSPSITATNTSPVISQRLLKDLRDARDQKNEAEARAKEHRRVVLELLDGHAQVEDGPLILWVVARKQKSVSYDVIAEILGQDALNKLLAAFKPKPVRTVFVLGPTQEKPPTPALNTSHDSNRCNADAEAAMARLKEGGLLDN